MTILEILTRRSENITVSVSERLPPGKDKPLQSHVVDEGFAKGAQCSRSVVNPLGRVSSRYPLHAEITVVSMAGNIVDKVVKKSIPRLSAAIEWRDTLVYRHGHHWLWNKNRYHIVSISHVYIVYYVFNLYCLILVSKVRRKRSYVSDKRVCVHIYDIVYSIVCTYLHTEFCNCLINRLIVLYEV